MSTEPGPRAVHEAFLDANANAAFVTAQVAELVRELLRAVAADKPAAAIFAAAERMTLVGELLARTGGAPSWYQLMVGAVAEIRGALPDDPEARRHATAALAGMAWLAEASARDEAARERASRRCDEFEDAIDEVVEGKGRGDS